MMPPARDLSTDGVASRVVPYRVVVQAIVMPLAVTVITVKSAFTSTLALFSDSSVSRKIANATTQVLTFGNISRLSRRPFTLAKMSGRKPCSATLER
jgi:hypothetical protein